MKPGLKKVTAIWKGGRQEHGDFLFLVERRNACRRW
jgi:hypothetical protein